MMHKTKMQRDAEDALWLQMQAEEKAKADRIAKEKKYPSEWDLKVEAWEREGMEWLKAGEELFGPRYDYEMELGRLGRSYSIKSPLPYEDLSAFWVNFSAFIQTIALDGILALLLSSVARHFGVPLWLCLPASLAYVVWRFRQRRAWILLKRDEADGLRKEGIPSKGAAHGAI
ncbi:hypothetical protein [Paracoccus cavernae]|uniref:hypothetical protein n=1 Tax=Paracoccus cavernae TaxID=1571207 RepID=UPI0035F3E9EA